jgi:hypothetical protein
VVGIARMGAYRPIDCFLDRVCVRIVFRLDDRSYGEESHVGSMRDQLAIRIQNRPSDFGWQEGRDSNRSSTDRAELYRASL